jgi:hypothetical protein
MILCAAFVLSGQLLKQTPVYAIQQHRPASIPSCPCTHQTQHNHAPDVPNIECLVAICLGVHLLHRSGQMEWEPGSNRVLDVPATAAEMQVSGQWGETGDTETLEVRNAL